VDLRERDFGQQREARRISDERPEGAGVEPAHQPIMLAFEDHRLVGERGAHVSDVVHAEPGRKGRRGDKWHPNESGILQPELGSAGRELRLTAKPAKYAGGDYQRNDELHDADAEIAEPGIERERVALLRLRKEETDIGHRR